MDRELREFRRLERVCLEQAVLETFDLARIGLLKVANDCRMAAEALEARSAAQPGALAALVQALRPSWGGGRAVSRP
ncbi:hypothetical protein JQ596_29725 [Bradyrhizobium manausense]|uniref:hypothetical protein n=1 Tax=Bradyrhizobium TaxID=374 RepID=UPI001BA4D5E3|nr:MULTISPECIES: hypothetical protein [Bradyrhizobium]MBR0829720.1 hypothetical protein [Bradyrhizobium manausense]UVO25333.1 hypothetical protein KUF59_22260 [Bradyrhizobium arachidis]